MEQNNLICTKASLELNSHAATRANPRCFSARLFAANSMPISISRLRGVGLEIQAEKIEKGCCSGKERLLRMFTDRPYHFDKRAV